MDDREKAIKGLRQCVGYEDVDNKYTCIYDGDTNPNCPYGGTGGDGVSCMTKMMRDALALLKAQAPRIVTDADFKNADEAGFIPAWCEEKDTGDVYCECISIGALEDAKFGRVRWWTSRPTDEQREAVKWE